MSVDDRRDPAKPSSLRLASIFPSITASDLDASLRFYRDILGFHVKETYEHEDSIVGAHLVAGAAALLVSQDDFAKGRDRQKGLAIRLNLQTTQSVDEVADRVRRAGGTLLTEPADMPWGSRAFNVADPDGFQITIMS